MQDPMVCQRYSARKRDESHLHIDLGHVNATDDRHQSLVTSAFDCDERIGELTSEEFVAITYLVSR